MGVRTLLQLSNEKIDKVMEETAQVHTLIRSHAHTLYRARGRTNVCGTGFEALFAALASLH
jgi:hypothetical protein